MCVSPLSLYTSLFQLVLCWAVLDSKTKTHIWKGGAGVLPWKILKTKKAEEAISGHFAGAILPSENEQFQRTKLPFIYALFEYKI